MDIGSLLKKYQDLKLHESIDFEKFNLYLITNHSTVIEGSTLTYIETQLLLDKDITPGGKPLHDSLMTKDHYAALLHVISLSKKKKNAVNTKMLQKTNALVMKNTGAIYNTALGSVDESKGDLRKMKVFVGKSSFPNYNKVPELLETLCERLNEMINKEGVSIEEQLKISFFVHFNLVRIHPFTDGNGRTARLLMNYIQSIFNLPLSTVYQEDKAEYYNALITARKKEDINIFYDFMFTQYKKQLNSEIDKDKKGSADFTFLF